MSHSSIVQRSFNAIITRAKANTQKKPVIAGRKVAIKSSSTKKKTVAGLDAAVENIVTCNTNERTPLSMQDVEKIKLEFHKKRYIAKLEELENMRISMEKAALALEKADPVLFAKAVVKKNEAFFPLERRYPTDYPYKLTNIVDTK